ncbi:ethanolamine ammonia-lyase subunit EutB [Actinomycetes bacterium KLBMP 9797]
MRYRSSVRGHTFGFADLRDLLAKASEEKSGDLLAGLAAGSAIERVAAQRALADVRLADFVAAPLIDDAVTALALDRHDRDLFGGIAALTVGELRELVLDPGFPAAWDAGLHRALLPEMAAAVAKIMSDKDLIVAAAPLRVVTRCRNTMGEAGTFGVRLQPNHPTDDVAGILVSVLDGLLFGCGDATIGVNPARDSVASTARILLALHELLDHLRLPTQTCVLAHLNTQLAALRAGAPVDLLFQSIAGTEAANDSFGIGITQLSDGRDEVLAHHAGRAGEFVGEQVMYFETGQGSALSAEAHHGIDQLTCEARAQGLARAFDPFLVNSVVGFIGPEYLANARQITRAGLEDHFVGKLLGLPMGVDVCYTNHVDADPNTNDDLLVLLTAAGCNFVMGVPGSDDVMLNYQSTSYHDAAGMRQLFRLGPAPEFRAWMERHGVLHGGDLADGDPQLHSTLEAGARRAVAGLPSRPPRAAVTQSRAAVGTP